MSPLSKKFLAIIILSVLAVAYSLPVLAQTAAADQEPPTACWTQQLCSAQQGNWAQTAESKTQCGKFEGKAGALGYCYAAPPSVDLRIAFGQKSVVQGLADYIQSVYNYLIAIVSIVAVVMIMVGGLRYLTAGGNPSAINSAKETILGAIIGLFLTLGSFILLQTVNPALVSLKLPDIKMIRTAKIQQSNISGGECYTIKDKATCEASCPGCQCHALCETNLEKIIKYTEITTASVLTLGANPAGTLSAAQAIAKAGISFSKSLLKFAVKHPVITGGTTAVAAFWTGSGTNDGERGTCYGSEKNSVGDWGVCEQDTECKEGSKCINASGVLQSGTTAGGQSCSLFKLCSNGDAGRPCEKLNPSCKAGLACLDTWLGGLGVCSDSNNRELFVKCDSDSQCKTGYCNPTSGSCGLTEGGATPGLTCSGSSGCTMTNWPAEWAGVCTNNYGISFASAFTIDAVRGATDNPNTSYCSDKAKKCHDRLSWLICNGKPSGNDVIGKCLKATTNATCQNNNECVYTCENGKCIDWPPTECK